MGSQSSRSPVPKAPLAGALAALIRPFEFAARDDYAHIGRVHNLESAVCSALDGLERFSLPSDLQIYFEELRERFSEPLPQESRAAAVAEALDRVSQLRPPDGPERLLARRLLVLPGVGPKRADSLARRGLASIEDLLFHLPSRYEDRRSLVHVEDLEVGRRATFMAEVLLVDFVTSRSRGRFRRMLQAVVGDDTGTVNLKWFRSADSIAKGIHKGHWLLITGDVKRYRFAKEIVHAEIERIAAGKTDDGAEASSAESGPADADPAAEAASNPQREPAGGIDQSALRQVVPGYSVPEGVNPRTLRGLIGRAVDEYADLVAGHLPLALVRERGLPDPPAALRAVHRPEVEADVEAYAGKVSLAHQRLVLEELYLLEVGLALRRAALRTQSAMPLDVDSARVRGAAAALPFELTGAQQRVWREIRADLREPHPMSRLLQGDVGSGKTAVALLAAVAVAASRAQCALMAPTELLAEQHARTLRAMAGGPGTALALRIGLLTASVPRLEAERIRAQLAEGALDLVVGTHALVAQDVRFAKLGLAVIDEQHRFGVRQRAALAEKSPDGMQPHILVMTATPIPRTLALTLYGDLDLSIIDERPPGRRPVETLLLREGEGRRITELVSDTVKRGEQVFVVYPLVEESEKVDLRSAMESAEKIRSAFSGFEVEIVHGRLDSLERADRMARFERGDIDILVSTTVIEVGVDVPAATLMIIEHAERFGLAQLHQLRGRVGRGKREGRCVMVARGGGEKGEARLRAMLETQDGFAIADADLAIRGPGEFLGTRQSGHLPDLRVADLLRDAKLVSVARQAALETVRADPELHRAEDLMRAVVSRWGDRLSLVGVG